MKSLVTRYALRRARCWSALFLVAPLVLGSSAAVAADDAGVKLYFNVPYRDPASKACVLDLAVPEAAAAKPRPAIVIIHGGGWIEGDKSSFASAERHQPPNIVDLARLGFVAATMNYRLAGEAPYPAALDDCRCAIRWLRANAQKYHVDSDHIGAYGNSAGGHLALLLAVVPPETAVKPGEPNAGYSSQVQAAVSDSGPLDLLTQHRNKQLITVIEKFMGGPPDGARQRTYEAASPASYVSKSIPPLLLIYGEADGQVDVATADRYVAALGGAGLADLTYIRLAKVDHCPHSLQRIGFLQPIVEHFFTRTLGLELTGASKN